MAVWLIAALVFGGTALVLLLSLRVGEKFLGEYRANFLSQARVNLADMFMFMEPGQLFRANAVALLVIPLLVWLLAGGLFAILAAVVLVFAPRKIYVWLRARRIERIQEQLPDALQMLASSLRAGVGFAPAMEVLVQDGQPPLAQELALVLRQQHMGVRAEAALDSFAKRVPIVDAELFVSAVNISREVGGNLAETLATLAETLRRRLIMEKKVKALTAQGKLQGIVMALLPVFLIGYLSLMYADTMQPMFHSWHGWLVTSVCLVMEYLGYRMCKKIMTIDV
ncbi:MAG: type II secretion protein F [Cupriavidus sp.]|uniref:Type II secretion system F family protein n=1 Tax=Thermomonas brevis TaxID=215691 RepID=A0A7G9QPH0_9GAMM|nr:type II secretion system F family protein [Thermomonas brevis]QNN45245.1 type II secretion system F family protein [Thermomonas brevis]TXI78824.1 MAG: type II secretion protein F [Cupriavidus sp.]